ncbi:DNA polymerase eta [Amia ocellicauda]|uniref:DNA polymerase eta n=1 Tax=Amia ocellicauda TaxID=2972642 RepID=UPI003464BF7F
MDYGKDRVVALVDMDCFYVQVEQRLNPQLKNKPCVVAQYKTWKGGGIIAVSYEARAHGVTRNMFADDAKKLCPDLQVARVRESHGKADLTLYREASVEVIEVMSRFAVVEKASIDEAYMDLTGAVQQRLRAMPGRPMEPGLLKTTHVQGFPQRVQEEEAVLDKEEHRHQGLQEWLDSLPSLSGPACPELQLAVGAVIVEEMRAAVEEHTGFRCSAGISHNKVLAKLACGLNKPNRQTVLPLGSIAELFSTLPVGKIRSLGGKLGASITETLEVENIGELTRFTRGQLTEHFGDKTGQWLYDLCRGIEFEPVKPRQLPKSIGCSKNFPGKSALATGEQVQHWLKQLALELEERLTKDRETYNRVAKQLVVGVRFAGDRKASSFSRCCALARYDANKISSDSYAIIKSLNNAGNHQAAWSPALTLLHLSASKFSEPPTTSASGISTFLSSDVRAMQKPTVSSSPAPSPQRNTTPKKGAIQSFFQKASDQRKEGCETEGSSPSKPTSLPDTETRLPLESPVRASVNTKEKPVPVVEYGKDRVVALVDMDCFFVQVEQRLNPELKNKPCAVALYQSWKGGGIIAVSYEARAYGVTRSMCAEDAKKLCPDLEVVLVREYYGKANLNRYRDASVEVIEVMSRFAVIERASIDEAYMDLTSSVQKRLRAMAGRPMEPGLLKTTHVQGFPQRVQAEEAVLDKEERRHRGLQEWLDSLPSLSGPACPELQLAVGAVIVEEMRAAVEKQTGFSCSAGISHNKVLAKLACGLNKPNRQTILPLGSIPKLFNTLPIRRIRHLGGKLGASITESLGVQNIGELTRFTEGQLMENFGDKTG